jgi:hypothetical protein
MLSLLLALSETSEAMVAEICASIMSLTVTTGSNISVHKAAAVLVVANVVDAVVMVVVMVAAVAVVVMAVSCTVG